MAKGKRIFDTISGRKIDVKRAQPKQYYNTYISISTERPTAIATWSIVGGDDQTFHKTYE